MEEVLVRVGLPVKCRKCKKKGFVKPNTDYGGWYKSKFYRLQHLKWYCPKHYEIGRKVDNQFYENYKTPDPNSEEVPQAKVEATTEELYKLLD